MAFEHKLNTGTIFKNEEYDPNGSDDDSNNYWGNMTCNVAGKIWRARLYPKSPKDPSKPKYMRVSFYEPRPAQPQQQPADDLPF
tara:strand:+ start:5371 stop:5622 length:252 start_codon:yes stop_codon:yes gene_type:complete